MTAVRVRGNRLVDQSGRQVVLRGVSHSGSEYTCVHGHGVFEGAMDSTFVAGLKSWKNLNAVRLPLNEDCWLGINGVPSDSGGAAYQAAYKKTVDLLTSANIAVLADLHWTAPGSRPRGSNSSRTATTRRRCGRRWQRRSRVTPS
jgi:endoglucanase